MRVLRLVAVYRVTVHEKKKNTDTSTVRDCAIIIRRGWGGG